MNLVPNVSEYIVKRSQDLASVFIHGLKDELASGSAYEDRRVESPLEQIFIVEWKYQEQIRGSWFPFELDPQFGSVELTGKYFLDFSIEIGTDPFFTNSFGADILKKLPSPLLGVEIDGHEFHEKTKKQVEYHKERERFLVSKGWKLLRYAGTEMFHNAEKCVTEVISLAWEARRKYIQDLCGMAG